MSAKKRYLSPIKQYQPPRDDDRVKLKTTLGLYPFFSQNAGVFNSIRSSGIIMTVLRVRGVRDSSILGSIQRQRTRFSRGAFQTNRGSRTIIHITLYFTVFLSFVFYILFRGYIYPPRPATIHDRLSVNAPPAQPITFRGISTEHNCHTFI